MNSLANYFFCIDGWATKAQGRLYDIHGKVLSTSKTGSVNIYNDINNSLKNIEILWDNCCKKAKLNKIHINTD